MIQQWQALLAQLEIIEFPGEREILSAEEIAAFEAKKKIVLPATYKEFCQVFGTGMFGDFVKIYCPSTYLSKYSKRWIETLKEEMRLFPSKDPMLDKEDENLLDSAFVFGDDSGANMALWDLRTYSESDQSCDIYWVSIDFLEEDIYKVGRNFFEFVRDFCLGMKSYEILPESKRPLPDNLHHTFTRFAPVR